MSTLRGVFEGADDEVRYIAANEKLKQAGWADGRTDARTHGGLYRGGGALSRNFPGTFLKFSFLLIAYGSPVPPPAGGKGAGFFP